MSRNVIVKLGGIFYLYLIILPVTTVVDWDIYSEGLSVLCNAREVFALHILPYCLKIMPGLLSAQFIFCQDVHLPDSALLMYISYRIKHVLSLFSASSMVYNCNFLKKTGFAVGIVAYVYFSYLWFNE